MYILFLCRVVETANEKTFGSYKKSESARHSKLEQLIDGHVQGTIHILRNHIFRIFGPPSPPLRNHVFSTENNQKLAFSDPPALPPTSDYVIYEWSPS